MGNSSSRGRHVESNGTTKVSGDSQPSAVLPSEPGRPVVKLSKTKSEETEVTDEIVLKWKPPSRRGNVRIQGYLVEMWDLGLNEWVRVLGTDDPGLTDCTLSNILSGMLYRFRVSAVTEAGLSLPSLPSEAFIINIPGVNIAPYWVTTPNHKFAYRLHDTLHFRLEALGTPSPNFHWYKDDEQIFIADGISMNHSQTATELIVENLQPEDAGFLKCSAVNTVGKIDWETEIRLFSPPEFDLGSLRRKYRYKTEERIRIKVPLIALPKPSLQIYRSVDNGKSYKGSDVDLIQSKDSIVFKINSAESRHSGIWILEASNEHGVSKVEFNIKVDSVPHRPSRPQVIVGLTDVKLTWNHDERDNKAQTRYLIEYYRDQWALWLNAKYSDSTNSVLVSDLIPGSYYKFRVKAVNNSGVSEPSVESESVMIRGHVDDVDDDLEDIAGEKEPYFSRSNSRRNKFKTESFRRRAKFASLSELSSVQKNEEDSVDLSLKERQSSLEREVYYDKDTRKEVVTYFKPSLHEKYKMTLEESERYKRSMTDLCTKILQVSSHSLHQANNRKSSIQSIAESSKDECLNEPSFVYDSQASNHRFSLPNSSYVPHEPPIPPPRRSKMKKHRNKSAVEKRIERRNAHRSLSELRGRISSLQNLLFAKKDETRRRLREEELSSHSLHSLSFFLESEEKIRPAPKVISVQNMTGLLETHFLVDSDDSLSQNLEREERMESPSGRGTVTESEGEGTLIQSSNQCTSKTLIPNEDTSADTDVSYSSIDLD